jgi:hypothetical protein
MNNEFYFQYNELGQPLFYFEFIRDFNYTFFTTSFIGVDSEAHFERAIDYPVICCLEKKEPDKDFFFELLDMDTQKYLYFEDSIKHDFILPRYIKRNRLDLNLFKSDRHILKKLQTDGEFRSEEFASHVIANYLNSISLKKFELFMNTKLQEISKSVFYEKMFDILTFDELFTTEEFYRCEIGLYELFFYRCEVGEYQCWMKQIVFK